MQSIPILLIDAGTGNLHSVFHTLLSITDQIVISDQPEDVLKAERIIMPGVGAFSGFMQGLQKKYLIDPIQDFVKKGNNLLGICVGMQALFDDSEEDGIHAGLGILPGTVALFHHLNDLKIPHTGWNQLWFQEKSSLLNDISRGDYVYFNHSYYCLPTNVEDISATTDYGIDFCSVVQHENVFGVQFHPEKSQKVGIQLLKNFIKPNKEAA
jgi:glutamine amidotransferase